MNEKDKEQYENLVLTFGKWRQILAAIIINISSVSSGVMLGWSSPMIEQFTSKNSPIGTAPFTQEEISWFSIISITALIPLPFCAWISEKYGRRVTGCFMGIPAIMSWILILTARNFYYILIARALSGIAVGLSFNLIPVYVAEIAAENMRGQLGCYFGFAINIGLLGAFVLGAVLPYYPFAACGLIIAIIFSVTFFFMPETPVYLIRKGRIAEGTRSLMWLRNNHKPTVDRELLHLQQQLVEISQQKTATLKDLFRDRGTIKGFMISLCLLTGQQTSGYSVVFGYTATIFTLAHSSLSPHTAAIFVAIIPIFGSYISTLIIERIGRRSLLLISCGGVAICHLIFGIFFLLQYQTYDISSFLWLPIAALCCYTLLYAIGLGPCPYVVTAEVLSPDVATIGISVSMVPVFVTSFLMLKFFPIINSELGSHNCFFIFSSFCVYTFLIIYFLVPETKGRSVESIFEELNGRIRN